MHDYTPSTVPGCRVPHFWLGGGRSLYDALGSGYTLLRFDPALDVSPLVAAASARRVPLAVLDVADADRPGVHRHRLLIVRPDQHVAWRGDSPPVDPAGLVERLRGAQE